MQENNIKEVTPTVAVTKLKKFSVKIISNFNVILVKSIINYKH